MALSPSRILRSGRNAPLPSQFLPFHGNINSVDKRKIEPATYSHQVTLPATRTHPGHLTGDSVKDYLRSHKSFLEDYLLSEIPVAVLQRLLKRKTCIRESGHEVAVVVGDAITSLIESENPKTTMMGDISSDIRKGATFKTVLYRLCKCTAEAAYADCFQLYVTQANSLVHVEGEVLAPQALTIPMQIGDTIPGHVAATKRSINISLIKEKYNFKFPKGSVLQSVDKDIKFILSEPIFTKNGDIVGVLELGRKTNNVRFSEEDEEIIKGYLSWATVILDCTNIHQRNTQSQLMFSCFDKITRSVIGSEWTFQSLFEDIRSTLVNLVDAENATIFMVNKSGQDLCLQLPSSNLYERLVSSESNEALFLEDANKLDVLSQSDIVFPGLSFIKRVANYVGRTGEVLNLNEMTRKKFVEFEKTAMSEHCKTILCGPLRMHQRLLGVIAAFNKNNGAAFTVQDKSHFMAFTEFCSLVLSSCKSHKDLTRTTNKYKVTNDILKYHRSCPQDLFEDIETKLKISLSDYPIHSFDFDCDPLHPHKKARLAALLLGELVGSSGFDEDKVLRFCLTVCRNYRPIPYHNWDHVFSVAHCMFLVIKGAPELFTEVEKMGFFVACLCHDLDHRGTNNAFLLTTKSPLADLYSKPLLENHHYSQAVALLQLDGNDIFSHLSDQEYLKVLHVMHRAIMASDIMQFFKNNETMRKLHRDGSFNWDNQTHKEVAQRMLITMCDLVSTFKPWPIHKAQVDVLSEEFYKQGDREKKLGLEPLAIMDRNYKSSLPNIQISFIQTFSLASSSNLVPIMPHVIPLRRGAESNIAKWKEILAKQMQERDENCNDSTENY